MYIKPFRWYGGKYRVIKEILALIPNYITMWFEVCCGSATVTLNKHIHPHEVINDLDDEIVNFFTVLADRREGANLVDRLTSLYHSHSDFILAKRARENMYRGMDEQTKAVMTFILTSQSFNALKRNYQNGMRQLDYRSDIRYNMPRVYERLE